MDKAIDIAIIALLVCVICIVIATAQVIFG
jgi:hypothetical protein